MARRLTQTRLCTQCDLLVIACSSFGEGDPPENYNLFLLNLQRAAEAGEKPLSGLQHVVIGYGASCYDTFQVCALSPAPGPSALTVRSQ